MTGPTLTFKAQSLYVAYAPDSGAYSFGGCFEEAVNSLADQLRSLEFRPDTELATKGISDADI